MFDNICVWEIVEREEMRRGGVVDNPQRVIHDENKEIRKMKR